MGIFEKNEQSLKQYRGHLYEHILGQQLTEREQNLIITNDIAKDGNKYMTITSGSKSYRLNSNYKPVEEAKRWSKSCFEDNNLIRIISVYGFGNGYFIRELCNRCNDRCIILVYEPFISVFMNTIREYDISDIISDVKVFLYIGQEAFKDFDEVFATFVGIQNVYITYELLIPYYDKIIPEDYYFFANRITGYKKELASTINTCAKLGRLFIENIFYSMNNIIGTSYISELRGKFPEDAPAVVVAAGPSLNKNILELKKLKNKAFIVATDAAFTALLKNGIVPDVVTSCDPIKMWQSDYDDFNKVPLICSFEGNPKMKEIHKGKRFYFGGAKILENFIHDMLGVNMPIPLSGSVATLSISMCVKFGFTKIVLVGQDLAYGEDGSTHVDHSEDPNKDTIIEVEGINGGLIKTRLDWYGYISALEEMIYINNHIEYIDATEGGALLHGSTIMKLSEVAERFKDIDYDYSHILNDAPIVFNEECRDKIEEYKTNLNLQFDCIKEKLKKAFKYCDKILISALDGKYSDDSYEVCEFKKINNEINAITAITYLHYYTMKDIKEDIQNINKGMEDEQSTWINHYQCHKKILEEMYNAIPIVKEMLNKDYSQEK